MSEEQNTEEIQAEEAAKPKQENLPVLLESTYTIGKLVIVVVGALTVGLSINAGADLFHIVLRSGTTLLVMGVLMWLISWFVTKASWQAVKSEMKAAADKLDNEPNKDPEA